MKKEGKAKKRNRSLARNVAYLGFAGAAALLILMVWAASHPSSPLTAGTTTSEQAPAAATPEGSERVPAYFTSADAARPFPTLLPAVDFRAYPSVQHAYAVATQIPGVLAQQPCYCNCDRMGHRSLLDCYASEHAAGCGVCLMEALFAGQLTNQGKSPASIRAEIIRGEWRNVPLTGPLP